MTTPNAEHNALFANLKPGAFRHPDHCFEWTRSEFQAWAEAISPTIRLPGRVQRRGPSRRRAWCAHSDGGVHPMSAPDPHPHRDLPDFSLVVLIGATGSGKSTFAARNFLSTEVISSDRCRALVSDSETDQEATADAFDLVREMAGKRLKNRRLAVIDATNVRPADRKGWIELARRWHALPVAIVLDPGIDVCIARNKDRPDRAFGGQVVQRMVSEVRQGSRRPTT